MSDTPTSLNTVLPAPVEGYTNLITSEYSGQPNFTASVAAAIQPFADLQAILKALIQCYDLDTAVGVQEDAVGLWVGRSRYLEETLNVYFSLDTAGLGLDQGIWYQIGDPLSGLTILDDDDYRILLRAVIAANNWNGTVPGAYTAWNILFAGTGVNILIDTVASLEMAIALVGQLPSAVVSALFTTGELDLKPAGVTLYHVLPTLYPAAVIPGVPIFGLDAQNQSIAGLDYGAWGYWVEEEVGVPYVVEVLQPWLWNDGGVLALFPQADWPDTSSVPGAVYSDGGVAAIVPGITPNPSAPPIIFGRIFAAQLLLIGGGNLPLPSGGLLPGQLYNNGNVICVA